MAEALAQAEAEEKARRLELESPDARRARQASRFAHADLSPEAARLLLTDVFASTLVGLDADPARFLSGVKLERAFGETAARVSSDGDGSLLESSIPVRAENEAGELKKVDLDLVQSADAFSPVNPLVDVRIPATLAEPIAIGEQGLAIAPAGAGSGGELLDGRDVFFPEALPDTDVLVAPTATGVEIFDQLRSAASPESFRYRMTLPAGSRLEATPAGGALVLGDGKTIAAVAPPTAVDAQGTPVPVTLAVDGEELIVDLPHRSGDFAYPILLDPAIHENYEATWYWGTNLEAITTPGIWQISGDTSMNWYLADTKCLSGTLCSPSNRGLFVEALDGFIPANQFLQWFYTVPGGTTFIPSIFPEPSAAINPFWRNDNGCGIEAHPQPHDYDGAFDAAGNFTWLETNRARFHGFDTIFTKAKGIAFGLSTGANGVNLPCNRDIMVGGVAVRLDDPERPTLSVSGFPSGWVKGGASLNVATNAADPGLGVQNVRVAPDGRPSITHFPETSVCPGTKVHPCPASLSAPFTLSEGQFDEGEKLVRVSASDPTGKISDTFTHTMRVDRTPPQITLSGSFAKATGENKPEAEDPKQWDELSRPWYRLHVRVTDGSKSAPENRRSGVKRVEIFVDEELVIDPPWSLPSCVDSCEISGDYDLQLPELGTGKHTLKVVAVDWLDQPRSRTVEFEYFPATGDKDEYVMERFPLPDGTDPEVPGATPWPELAVNVANGNVLFEQRDVDLDGPAVDLEVERVYNSLLPESLDSEWGDGWTIAQTPELDPMDTGGSPAPDRAEVVDSSGTIEDKVILPVEAGATTFDPGMQATITKASDGGFEIEGELGGEVGSIEFNEAGRVETHVIPAGVSPIEVDYSYEEGELSEIAVEDPTSTTEVPTEPPPVPVQGKPTFVKTVMPSMTGSDMARDPDGGVWVVDKVNRILRKFSGNGTLVPGAGGQLVLLSSPTALDIDRKGGLILADSTLDRVFTVPPTSNVTLSMFAVSVPGVGPEGMAVDRAGSIWLTDTVGGRILKHGPGGVLLGTFGSKGSGPGQLLEPRGIDVAPNGEVWVVDGGNNRVSVFDESGAFLRNVGSKGTGNGEFERPRAIDFDGRGIAWVTDPGNGRVQGFTPDGKFHEAFGSPGSGPGKFGTGTNALTGIVADAAGRFWILGPGLHKWETPNYIPDYSPAAVGAWGGLGAATGLLNRPGDVAIDDEGLAWVVDSGNNRVQQFHVLGQGAKTTGFLGEHGSMSRPTAMVFDAQGNFWVTDSNNNRLLKFNSEAKFLQKAGAAGSGNGQLSSPEGIAIGPEGNLWVADTNNNRVQVFNGNGAFVRAIGSEGSGPGQFKKPAGLDFGPHGSVFVADTGNDRVQELSASGEFVAEIDSDVLQNPVSVEVDEEGLVWVADSVNDAISVFGQEGELVQTVGSKGTGKGKFELDAPAGLAISGGKLFVADTDNHRLQRWMTPAYEASELVLAEPDVPDDPSVEVEATGDLISAVSGAEAGEHTYEHDGDDLIAHEGPAGETTYEYDADGLMTRVELPNGTVAEMTYEAVSARVKTVSVDPAGGEPAATTTFTYDQEEPRTTVERPGKPAVEYLFNEDGSVFKSSNAPEPPEAILSGTLWVGREGPEISTGLHNLEVQAHSEHGIRSIEIVDGDAILSEKHCAQNLGAPGTECIDQVDELVVETIGMTPGIHGIEVLVTDELEQILSRRFWVNVPYTPPPPEEAEPRPTFSKIKRYRIDHGLDLDLDPESQELELNNRIYDLLGAWGNPHTPLGEVARYGTANWGVPMRPIDVSEMEYRDWYMQINTPMIESWAEQHHPSTYAGVSVDHAAGGIMRVAFTADAAARVSELKAQLPLVAADRLSGVPATHGRSLVSLAQLEEEILVASDGNSLLSKVTTVDVDRAANVVRVGASDAGAVANALQGLFGSGAPVTVAPETVSASAGGPWVKNMAGEHWIGMISNEGLGEYGSCTSGYGAYSRRTRDNGEVHVNEWQMSAGHCALDESVMERSRAPRGGDVFNAVGLVRLKPFNPNVFRTTDILAVDLNNEYRAPRYIFKPTGARQVNPAGFVHEGDELCFSGLSTGAIECGDAEGYTWIDFAGPFRHGKVIKFDATMRDGDSGAPVWNRTTGKVVGIMTSRGEGFLGRTLAVYATPLLQPPNTPFAKAPGAFGALSDELGRKLDLIEAD